MAATQWEGNDMNKQQHVKELEGIGFWSPETREKYKDKSHEEIIQENREHYGDDRYSEVVAEYIRKAPQYLTKYQADFVINHQLETKAVLRKCLEHQDPLLNELHMLVTAAGTTKDGRPLSPEADGFADSFDRYHDFAKIIGDHNLGHLLYRKGTVYAEGAYEMIERIIEAAYSGTSSHFRREVIAKIGARNSTGRDEFDNNPRIRNVKNGFLDLEKMDLVDPPDYKSMRQLDFEFRPDLGPSELFEQKMAEWMPDEETRNGLWEIGSTAFLKDSIRFENVVMLQGDGANGKSTFLYVLLKMLGKGNVTALSWQDIEHNRFAPQRLDGAYANIFYDMDPDALKSTARMRSLVDREPISVERKGVDGYDMTYKGRMIFSCNTLPELPDMGHFMMRRLLLFKFENKFTGETKIGNLREMLTTPEEKSKIFNSFLPYIQKILKNGRISYTQDEGKLRNLWMRHSSSSTQFAVEMLERTVSVDGSLKTKEIYEMYLKWCHDHTKTPDPSKIFTKALENQLYLQIRTTYKGEKTTYWKNMRIKGSDNNQQETL